MQFQLPPNVVVFHETKFDQDAPKESERLSVTALWGIVSFKGCDDDTDHDCPWPLRQLCAGNCLS